MFRLLFSSKEEESILDTGTSFFLVRRKRFFSGSFRNWAFRKKNPLLFSFIANLNCSKTKQKLRQNLTQNVSKHSNQAWIFILKHNFLTNLKNLVSKHSNQTRIRISERRKKVLELEESCTKIQKNHLKISLKFTCKVSQDSQDLIWKLFPKFQRRARRVSYFQVFQSFGSWKIRLESLSNKKVFLLDFEMKIFL